MRKNELNVLNADELVDPGHETQELATKALRFIQGGEFGKKHPDPNKFDQKWFDAGTNVEAEHTPDVDWQRKIASDHFAEHGDIYYPVLKVGEDFMSWFNKADDATAEAGFRALKDFVKKLTTTDGALGAKTEKALEKGILDESQPGLCPEVWDGETLKAQIRAQILRDAKTVLGGETAKNTLVVGSLTGPRYVADSDLDVTLVVSTAPASMEAMKDRVGTVNGKMAPGTDHPINFYLMNTPKLNLARFDAAYDVETQKWVKKGEGKGADLFHAYEQFKREMLTVDIAKAEVWRSLVDVEKLRDAVKHGANGNVAIKLRRRLEDLNEAVAALVGEFKEVHQTRVAAFLKYEEMAAAGSELAVSPNLLPENVRYKLFERYQYLQFLKAVYQLVKETGDIDTQKDLDKLRDILESKAPEKGLDPEDLVAGAELLFGRRP